MYHLPISVHPIPIRTTMSHRITNIRMNRTRGGQTVQWWFRCTTATVLCKTILTWQNLPLKKKCGRRSRNELKQTKRWKIFLISFHCVSSSISIYNQMKLPHRTTWSVTVLLVLICGIHFPVYDYDYSTQYGTQFYLLQLCNSPYNLLSFPIAQIVGANSTPTDSILTNVRIVHDTLTEQNRLCDNLIKTIFSLPLASTRQTTISYIHSVSVRVAVLRSKNSLYWYSHRILYQLQTIRLHSFLLNSNNAAML